MMGLVCVCVTAVEAEDYAAGRREAYSKAGAADTDSRAGEVRRYHMHAPKGDLIIEFLSSGRKLTRKWR